MGLSSVPKLPLSGPSQRYLNYNTVNPTPGNRHAGIDYAGSRPVYAPVEGIVRAA